MIEVVMKNLLETVKIMAIVIGLMTAVNFLELRYEENIRRVLTERPWNQYIFASILGAIPGCIVAFLIDSLYISGLVSFGTVVSVMLSTAGDEAFIMLAMIPGAVPIIFAVDVIVGLIGGFLSDKVAQRIKLGRAPPHRHEIQKTNLTAKCFFREHFYGHIIREHVPSLFLWLFLTMVGIDIITENLDWFEIIQSIPYSRLLLLIIAALVGMIPISGPHFVFVKLYQIGAIPLSVLLVSTMSQDGHGLLPLLSYSVRDTINVQIATTIISLIVAIILFFTGI